MVHARRSSLRRGLQAFGVYHDPLPANSGFLRLICADSGSQRDQSGGLHHWCRLLPAVPQAMALCRSHLRRDLPRRGRCCSLGCQVGDFQQGVPESRICSCSRGLLPHAGPRKVRGTPRSPLQLRGLLWMARSWPAKEGGGVFPRERPDTKARARPGAAGGGACRGVRRAASGAGGEQASGDLRQLAWAGEFERRRATRLSASSVGKVLEQSPWCQGAELRPARSMKWQWAYRALQLGRHLSAVLHGPGALRPQFAIWRCSPAYIAPREASICARVVQCNGLTRDA
mmetsp:Transcript_98032/g.305300  ORF Transcript_98032/g.305300 Transcript_98032/m.305300 type:complete len:286 (-) Transcript_98032:2-859(-)